MLSSREHLLNMLGRAPLFRALDTAGLMEIESQHVTSTWQRGECLFKASEHGNNLHVVLDGCVELMGQIRGETIPQLMRECRPGDLFGEETLFRADRKYLATALARENSRVLEVPVALLRRTLTRRGREQVIGEEREEWRRRHLLGVLRSTGFFNTLNSADLARLSVDARALELGPGDVLFREGEEARHFYVIGAGMLKLSRLVGDMEHIRAWLSPGDVLGDMELRHQIPYVLTATSTTTTEVLSISADLLRSLLRTYPGLGEHVTRLTREGMERAQQRGRVDLLVQGHRLQVGRSTMVIDLARCIRCGNCSWSCEETHGISRLVRRGQRLELPTSPSPLLLPTSCQHCTDAACMAGCPTGAIGADVGGDVFVRESSCIGCGDCAKRCPWGNISMVDISPGQSKAVKCDNCKDFRVSACAHSCPTGALSRMDVRSLLEGGDRAETLAIEWSGEERQLDATLLWLVAPLVIPLGACLAEPAELRGASHLGVLLGLGSMATLGLTTFYSARKRGIRRVMSLERRKVGEEGMAKDPNPITVPLRRWLPPHVGLGASSVVMVYLHAGGWPDSLLGVSLMSLLVMVLVTGLVGLLAYQLIPPLLTRIEGVPYLVEDLETRVHELTAELVDVSLERPPSFGALLHRVETELRYVSWSKLVLLEAMSEVVMVREVVATFLPQIQQMGGQHRSALVRAVEIRALLRHLRIQQALHWALRGWLVPHILAAVALVTVVVVHLIVIGWY